MNHFQKVVVSRIEALKRTAEVAAATEHGTATGNVREEVLRRFLRDATPTGVAVTQGFLIDAMDRISPQLDFIAASDLRTPSLFLEGDVALVPVEAALVGIEVKETLNKSSWNSRQ